jgi:putative transposase
MEPRKPYPTDLSDKEWDLIKHLVPNAKPGGRPEKYPKRKIVNGIFYVVRGGCAWRLLPHDIPPWQVMNDLLRGDVRTAVGKRRQPTAGIMDSQSVKTTEKGGSAGLTRTSRSKAANGTSLSTRPA